MKVGMLTAPFANEPLETVLQFAERAAIPCLEVTTHPGSKHIDPAELTPARSETIKNCLADRELEISSLAYYEPRFTDPAFTPGFQRHAKKCIDAAAMLDVSVVCLLAGFPAHGMTKINTIRKVLPKIFSPILRHAAKKNIKIAIENWFATCLQGLDTFECLFEAIPDERFGLNYDPSHLVWQRMDYCKPLWEFQDRIFHVHAKDARLDQERLNEVGILATPLQYHT
ncbi:MAG TPA: sugar phosphate isomerase/epimerase, partial [Candidatus Hydrogenedentes bacterium]|nr:sugar phosphate isomerase/epimerase [Candidatus Hydrogenedentota bacterium]